MICLLRYSAIMIPTCLPFCHQMKLAGQEIPCAGQGTDSHLTREAVRIDPPNVDLHIILTVWQNAERPQRHLLMAFHEVSMSCGISGAKYTCLRTSAGM